MHINLKNEKMKRLVFITIILFTASIIMRAQTTTKEKFFKDQWVGQEVPKEKAKYSETTSTTTDGFVTIVIKQIKNDNIITSRTYNKNGEPFGIWIENNSGSKKKEMDYNFTLNYSDSIYRDSTTDKIPNIFENDEAIGYVAPIILTGEKNIYEFLGKKINYPHDARISGISGMVVLLFKINIDGQIENIAVKKGVNVYLDKEAVRIMRLLNFSKPPYLNNKPISAWVAFPIKFTLQ
jgi:TonB family protein